MRIPIILYDGSFLWRLFLLADIAFLCYYSVLQFEVSRSPKFGLPISGNLGVRLSDSQYQEILESECLV